MGFLRFYWVIVEWEIGYLVDFNWLRIFVGIYGISGIVEDV